MTTREGEYFEKLTEQYEETTKNTKINKQTEIDVTPLHSNLKSSPKPASKPSSLKPTSIHKVENNN